MSVISLLCGTILVKRSGPVSWRSVLFLNSSCLFPSTFLSPHLFLLLLDTALPIPLSPLFSATAPPTTPLSSTYCVIPILSSISSWHMPKSITPLGAQVHSMATKRVCWTAGRNDPLLRHVLRMVYRLMVSVSLCVLSVKFLFFFVKKHS